MTTMTKEEFEERYAHASKLPRDELFAPGCYVALACACGDRRCLGWAAVTDHPIQIKSHLNLYAPKAEPAT